MQGRVQLAGMHAERDAAFHNAFKHHRERTTLEYGHRPDREFGIRRQLVRLPPLRNPVLLNRRRGDPRRGLSFPAPPRL